MVGWEFLCGSVIERISLWDMALRALDSASFCSGGSIVRCLVRLNSNTEHSIADESADVIRACGNLSPVMEMVGFIKR